MNWLPLSTRPHFFAAQALARRSLLLLSFVLTPGVLAQEAPPTPDELTEIVKQLRKQVADLEARTKELEARLKQTTVLLTPTPTPAPAQAIESIHHEEQPVKAEPEPNPLQDHTGHGAGVLGAPNLQIRGFSDVNYFASNVHGQPNTFTLGQLDLFVTSRLSDKMNVLAEMALKANDRNSFAFVPERILLQYTVNDYFTLNVGRFHTALGYYNAAFHHGTWFQTTTGRPFIFAFEGDGGILPIHNVGISINGRLPSGDLRLSYVAEIGNGRTSRSKTAETVQNRLDENNGKAFNFGLQARPRWTPGLQVGFNIYRDRLTPDGVPKVGQTILASHAIYQTPSFEFFNEGVWLRHTLSNSQRTSNTLGFYSQVSRRFYNRLRPYFRYEYLNVPERDPINGEVGRRNGPVLGVRYELGEFATVKWQYDRMSYRYKDTSNTMQLQFAFTF